MEEETIKFISILENQMKKQELNNYQLSQKVGVPNSTIDRLFQLKSKPNLDLVIKIMKELKVKKLSI